MVDAKVDIENEKKNVLLYTRFYEPSRVGLNSGFCARKKCGTNVLVYVLFDKTGRNVERN